MPPGGLQDRILLLMEVIRQDKFFVIRIANSFKNSNTYVIVPNDDDKVWLVDIGDLREVESVIGDKQIAGIFLTHAHLDHIYGIKEALQKFPDCVVYGSGLCLEYLHDDRKNLSFYYECPLSLRVEKCSTLLNDTEMELKDFISIKCFFTPGHTPDSICYQIRSLIFTGDSYIPGIPTVTKLRGGNKLQAFESIELIKSKINPTTIILPGHGAVSNNLG